MEHSYRSSSIPHGSLSTCPGGNTGVSVGASTKVAADGERSITPASSSIEQDSIRSYHPPMSLPPPKKVAWVYNPSNGSVLTDHKGRPVSVDKLLATKPLRGELSTRPGPGGKKLTYISGEGVTRTLNDIFGFDGWNLDITRVQREECLKDDKTGRYTVVYTAMVRLTHRSSGSHREDCGAGDSTDRCFGTAVSHALKASITDAIKRAARHFGDKLGNSLYQGNFSASKAPVSLKDALDKHEIERANTKFGFPKDQPNKTHQSTQHVHQNTKITAQRNPSSSVKPSKDTVANGHSSTVATAGSSRVIPAAVQHKPATSAISSNAQTKSVLQTPMQPHLSSNRNSIGVPSVTPAGSVVAPPTPMDSLRNSALFAAGQGNFAPQMNVGSTEPSISRPQISSLPGSAMSTSLDSQALASNSRRISFGDDLSLQPSHDQNISPNKAGGYNFNSRMAKRIAPPMKGAACPEAPPNKRVALNPYASSGRM